MTFREELEQLDVEFLHGVPVKLPPATITSIINLVDKSEKDFITELDEHILGMLISREEMTSPKASSLLLDRMYADGNNRAINKVHNILQIAKEQRAIIRSGEPNKNKGSE